MAGDSETGVTIFRLDAGMDTGDILVEAPTIIEPQENAGRLLNRLTNLAISLLDEALALVESGLAQFRPQIGESSHAAKLVRNECRIDWSMSARDIENLIRGANPEPMAYTMLGGEPFRILQARALPSATPEIGIGAVTRSDNRVLVGTSAGSLELLEVQPASKNAMQALDWARGRSGEVVFE
jgi:methionyl-tRNA formyltransferase